MKFENLAPWIAIAITLALSILVPLFTQIANNRFQYKKAKQDYEFEKKYEQQRKRREAYENFLKNVGAAIEYRSGETLRFAGASIGQIYLYVPEEIHVKLDLLFNSLRECEWASAEEQYFELTKFICELNSKLENPEY